MSKDWTITEFAREIGVSIATVSRAIHGSGRISPVTRRMVLRRMEELEYTPNLHAQRLKTGRSRMIALSFLGSRQVLSDMFLVTLSGGIQQALHAHGYGLQFNLMEEPEEQKLLLRRWVQSQAVDGTILVCGPEPDRELLGSFARLRSPCTAICPEAISGVPYLGSVVVDLRQGAGQTARLLAAQGHRRIGFIGAGPPDPVLTTFRAELHNLGMELRAEDMLLARSRRPEEGLQAAETILARSDAPTALFARTDMLALGILQSARRRGLRIPGDLAIVGHDDVAASAWTDPPLSTVRVNCPELGEAATETLLELLDSPESEPAVRVVPTELVQRATTAPRLP